MISRMESALKALDGPLALHKDSPFRAFVEERGQAARGDLTRRLVAVLSFLLASDRVVCKGDDELRQRNA